ncbi:MAG TPA: IS200/IS605 family transposase [Saprospiraceae bacterium]|nr:IS200/IS605 family transposase [Saprospiraceae bacterium]
MANTYTQLHVHFVFGVKYRRALIHKSWKDELYKYMGGIIQNQGHKILLINGVEDHVHLLAGLRPVQSISDLMEKVKGDSSAWINTRQFLPVHFNWQGGYGAFALSKTHIDRVYKYILNQEEHHRKRTFREEYIDLLKENGIEFDEKYIFKDPE